MNSTYKKHRQQLYYLHYRVRKAGFRLITQNRTIYWYIDDPLPSNPHLNKLVNDFGYSIQTELKHNN